MDISQLPNAIVASLPLAGVYAVVALGWVVLFRATGILNFATGQFVAIGAYSYYTFATVLELPFLVAIVAAMALTGLIGAGIHMGLMRRMAGAKGFAPIVLTMGVSIVIQHVITMVYGGGAHALELPIPLTSISLPGHIAFTAGDILIVVMAVVLVVGTILLTRYSRWGIQMRAAAENPLLASQSGINVDHVFVLGWVGTAMILSLLGIVYGFATIVTPEIAGIGIRGLSAAIVGGIDSIPGVIPGAILVALVENLSVLLFGEGVRDAAVMVVLLLVIALRPSGLLGTRNVTRI